MEKSAHKPVWRSMYVFNVSNDDFGGLLIVLEKRFIHYCSSLSLSASDRD